MHSYFVFLKKCFLYQIQRQQITKIKQNLLIPEKIEAGILYQKLGLNLQQLDRTWCSSSCSGPTRKRTIQYHGKK
jgi:hypothetical protein